MHNRYMGQEGTLVREAAAKPSLGDFNSDSYSLYFKGFIREETTVLLAGFGVAIYREDDDNNLLFQMKGSLHDSAITILEAELMALKRGLTEAVSLGIDHISIYCDHYQIFELVMGRSVPEQENIALLMDDVQRIRQQFTSSIPVLVTGNQDKFAYKLAIESISIPMPHAQKKTCGICLDDDIKAEQMFSVAFCRHQFCVDCVKLHIEVELVEARSVPRCPHYGCKSNLTLRSCAHLLTPRLQKMWERRIKQDSIPEWDRFHCPKPRCSALMSKTELFESTQEDGVKRSCFKCRKPFCINCKVAWHSNLSCEEYKRLGPIPTTMQRQCRKCNHMIELSENRIYVTCRCGYSICNTCGAQWRRGGCLHRRQMEADALFFVFLLIFFIVLVMILV